MTFLGLIVHNLSTRRFRSVLTGAAVAFGVTAVVALGVLTHSLEATAVSILRAGNADFTVAEEGSSDLLDSTLDATDLATIRAVPGVEQAIGVFVATNDLDEDHPLFIEIGIDPADLEAFGVRIVEGRAFGPTSPDEAMLGYRAASDLGADVGDFVRFHTSEDPYRIVGLFSTGVSFGDSAAMMSLPSVQAFNRRLGQYTLAFVRVEPGADVQAVRDEVEKRSPHLATVVTASEFGRVDRNLALLRAADSGGTILALLIGAAGVANTSLLSFYERIREFGLLRAVGWSRRRLAALVFGETFVVAFPGAALGTLTGTLAVEALTRVEQLKGVFIPEYTSDIFGRALGLAFAMAFLGTLYPVSRAMRLQPLDALRKE